MLPTVLSECLCSLLQDETRFVLTGEFTIKNDELIKSDFYRAVIKVNKNYSYDEPELLQLEMYKQLFDRLKILSKK